MSSFPAFVIVRENAKDPFTDVKKALSPFTPNFEVKEYNRRYARLAYTMREELLAENPGSYIEDNKVVHCTTNNPFPSVLGFVAGGRYAGLLRKTTADYHSLERNLVPIRDLLEQERPFVPNILIDLAGQWISRPGISGSVKTKDKYWQRMLDCLKANIEHDVALVDLDVNIQPGICL